MRLLSLTRMAAHWMILRAQIIYHWRRYGAVPAVLPITQKEGSTAVYATATWATVQPMKITPLPQKDIL